MSESASTLLLMVGCPHLDNPGRDMVNTRIDDVLAPRRQAEIASVVARLTEFGANKVAVEAAWDDPSCAERYAGYRAGELDLDRTEVEQIAFRVAAASGHQTVHQIDVADIFHEPALDNVLAVSPGARQHYESALQAATADAAEIEAMLAEHSIGAVLARMNSKEALDAAYWVYLRHLAPISDPPAYPGPDMVANWVRRNLRILAHLRRVSEPGDLILVVFGQGHVAAFRALLAVDDTSNLVDLESWLR